MICLKVDIDTYEGAKKGIPPLIHLFEKEKIQASFFVSLGPDESGKAIKRILKKGFLKKMFRSNAAKLYGFKTMAYGTILPAPIISEKLVATIKQIETSGQELGIHAWSHTKWQDELPNLSEREIENELAQALSAYKKITNHDALGFAAPAWQINKTALNSLSKHNFKYISATRGKKPVFLKTDTSNNAILEIPTTIPTLDEILAWDNITKQKALKYLTATPKKDELNVYTLHTEVEGNAYLDFFTQLIKNWKNRGFKFFTLDKISGDILSNPKKFGLSSEPKEIIYKTLPGRAGKVAATD